MKTTVEYTNATGTKVRIEMEYINEFRTVEIDDDGYKFNSKELYQNQSVKLFINGTEKVSARHLTEVTKENKIGMPVNAPIGSVMIQSGNTQIALNGHTEEIISAWKKLISEGTSDEVKAAEAKEAAKEIEETEKYNKLVENGLCTRCGTFCDGDCQA